MSFEHGSFSRILDDQVADHSVITRVVLASGKIAHEALGRRDELGLANVAVVRVEQIYPWPAEEIESLLASYPNAHEVVWLQEEPENMARAESASPATGSHLVHDAEQADLLVRALQ